MTHRSMGSATINFGLVAIPVKFYVTAKSESVSFNEIAPNGRRTKRLVVDDEGNEIAYADIRKGYEYAKDQYVIFSKEELKKLEAEKDDAMEILEFIPAKELDTIAVETTYLLDAGKGGDRAYRLLAAALKKTKRSAVAQWTTHGRQKLMVIAFRGNDLVAHEMYYANELRELETRAAAYVPKENELLMAAKLIETLVVDEFDLSKYKNTFIDRVAEAVEQKKSGKDYVPPTKPATPVNDLFEALRASLDDSAEKKPKAKKTKSSKAA